MRYERCVFMFLFFLRMGLCEANVENFGPYERDWLKYETCKGPKKGNCGTVRVENTQNMSDVVYILDIVQDCPVTKARISISKYQNNGTTENKLWNYRLDKPCQHFVLGPVLVNSFNLNDRCKIKKGHYEVRVNMEVISRKFLGPSFFYGIYCFKIMAFNDHNNFICQLAVTDIKKPLTQ